MRKLQTVLFLTLKIDLSTETFTQYSVMTYMGIESEKRVTIRITDSPCYIEETNNIVSEASLVAQVIKNLPAMQETGFDPWVGKITWRREWLPTPVFFPGNFHGQRSLVGYSPWAAQSWIQLSD